MGNISGPDYAKNPHFGELTFGTHIKSMESCRNIKVVYTVPYDMADITQNN